ncbi:hypothetical protein RJ639_044111 [Escallonia herrerae]|uniref:Uncharacterized protein n=1 Tax=Escallonia herrerae TaxID=1293975 RepID=A0AA88WBV5_9ASTE|nr:hypothetical protein RJ639_044111 [Escallonia herrerae]
MMFLLTALKVQYVLDPNLPPLPEITDNDSDETKAARKKREEDELVCRGHILNALSDHLYDLFTSSKCPREIWKALENKYNNEKQGTDKFLTLKYFEFTMNDSESVMDQGSENKVIPDQSGEKGVELFRAQREDDEAIVPVLDLEPVNKHVERNQLKEMSSIDCDQIVLNTQYESYTNLVHDMFSGAAKTSSTAISGK